MQGHAQEAVALRRAGAADAEGALSRGASATSMDGIDNATAGRLLVLIPAYNEEENLPRVIAGVRDAVPDADDPGRRRLQPGWDRVGSRGGPVRRSCAILSISDTAPALLTGYRYADRKGYDRLVQIDGDGQHDPGWIVKLLEAARRG